MEIPDPRYLETQDGVFIAYQVVGDGPVDIAWQFDFGWNLDVWWEWAWIRDWLSGLASFGRLILHDARGFGLSSRNVPVPNLETRADDLRSVLDEVDSTSAVIGGWFEGLAPGILLAASHPGRVRALVWWNPMPRTVWAPDYPWGEGPEDVARNLEALKHWGTGGSAESWADADGAVQRPSTVARDDPVLGEERAQHMYARCGRGATADLVAVRHPWRTSQHPGTRTAHGHRRRG